MNMMNPTNIKAAGCPVNTTICYFEEIISRMDHPRSRYVAEEIIVLLKDIAWGRAGEAHLPAILSLSSELADIGNPEAAKMISSALAEHREIFVSHIRTHNCATGDCVKLTPAPCQMACPAGIDIPTYVTLIGMGKDAEAIEVIRKDNPFPWVCGLVCTRPCEFMCVRGRIDKPVSIKFLKAFAAERAMSEGRYKNPDKEPDKGKKACIIGAGPAGMSAAYYLALKGYGVRVIEALPVAGGMIMVGIPRYRLPREVIDREVAMLEDLGVEFCFDTRFGKDITLDELKTQGFEAFFFAIGAHSALKMGIAGETQYSQVVEAIDLLKRVALGERRIHAKKVIVIGGGNVAVDAARTCLRLGCEEVIMAYRRTRAEMPADIEEVEQAEEEGVEFAFLTVPIEISGQNGKMTGLQCLKAELVARPGETRKSPVPIEGSNFMMPADLIISAIGQRADQTCMASLSDLRWTRRNTIETNKISMETSVPGIFAAGDVVTGPATVVEAIGGGKRAAQAIDRYLSGIPQPEMPPVPVRRRYEEHLTVSATAKMSLQRPEMPLLNIERRRTMFQQVELGYTENTVREEARRCLRCDICRRCGECVRICRDEMKINALKLGYLEFDHPTETDFGITQKRCIACGACANNCPNNAMQIQNVNNKRTLSLCGTILNRQELLYCEHCGAALGTEQYLKYVRSRIRSTMPLKDERIFCNACQRKNSAATIADTVTQEV